MTQDAQEIQSQMQSIRSRSKLQKMQFVDDSARMLDWKEHVRAMPVTALVASVVVGFTLLYKKSPSRSQSIANAAAPLPPQPDSFAASLPLAGSPAQQPAKSAPNPLVSAALSMATSILLTSGKQFILKNIQTILSEANHERQQKPGVHDQVL